MEETVLDERVMTRAGGKRIPEVEVRGVGVNYWSIDRSSSPNSDRFAIKDIDLTMERSECTVLVGPSGCGKTTLLNLIAGLLHPSQGTILVRGKEPTTQHSIMSYMLARDGLLPWRSALSNVELPLEGGRSRLSGIERRQRALEMLRRVGLAGYETYHPHQLSQGMRQRVALARAFVADPELLLMDEPFGRLDAQTKMSVQSEFLETWEGSGRTAIFVTHDLQEALLLADRIVVMKGIPGTICWDQRISIPRPRASRLSSIMISDEFRVLYHKLIDVLAQ